jgi:gag-polypeptide of LTR copia-type
MSGTPSLTILSKEQKFNGENLLQWKTNMIQLLASKGPSGYINGRIGKPGPESIPLPDTSATIHLINTPIYLTTPTLDKWVFWDKIACEHITLNCIDVTSLGIVTTGTAKDAWDSIQVKWRKSTDMCCLHVQEALNRTEYAEGTDIQEHIKLLQTHRVVVDNLSTQTMSDKTWRGIIIRSIPPTAKWLPVIPSLYSMTTSTDIISTLLAYGMILGRVTSTKMLNTVLAARITEGCTVTIFSSTSPLLYFTLSSIT